MDPPVPSIKPEEVERMNANFVEIKSKQDFAENYNTRIIAAGCFTGDNLITMATGSKQPVSTLARGDSVATPNGTSKIKCIIKTVFNDNKMKLC